MTDGSEVAAFAGRLFDAMVAGDVETVIAMYDPSPDTLVFLEAPRWATHGGERVAVDGARSPPRRCRTAARA